MSEKFTASNGLTLSFYEDGIIWEGGTRPRKYTEALREFFLHERDQELGRWRWPEDRNYVVYHRTHGDRFVHVYHEPSTGLHTEYRGGENDTSIGYSDAAQAYFAAHPESKPWHDAKPGEVWVVKTKHNDQERPVFVNSDGDFENAEEYFHPEFRDITAGRRIWPEVCDAS